MKAREGELTTGRTTSVYLLPSIYPEYKPLLYEGVCVTVFVCLHAYLWSQWSSAKFVLPSLSSVAVNFNLNSL